MMILRSSPPSPFGRKVKIALAILGLKDQVTIENADTVDPSDKLRSQNPLGKIPALVLANGEVLYDSSVILEYLDFLAGGNRLCPAGEARFPVLRDASLANGLMDAGILLVYERRFRPKDYRYRDWITYQEAKVERALGYFEANCPAAPSSATDLNLATLTLACALGYLDLRFAGRWRAAHPKLSAWIEAVEATVPAFAATKVPPAPISDDMEPQPLR